MPSGILDPASTWPSREEYMKKYDGLAARFIENFKLMMQEGYPKDVVAYGPRRA